MSDFRSRGRAAMKLEEERARDQVCYEGISLIESYYAAITVRGLCDGMVVIGLCNAVSPGALGAPPLNPARCYCRVITCREAISRRWKPGLLIYVSEADNY